MWLGEDDSAAVDSKACDGILKLSHCNKYLLHALGSCTLAVLQSYGKIRGIPWDTHRIPLLGFYDATAGER